MTISSYQIQNILQIYNRQLKARWKESGGEQGAAAQAFPKDKVEISDEGKKKHIMEKAGDTAVKNLKQQTLESTK